MSSEKTHKAVKFRPKRTFGVELEFPRDYSREILRDLITEMEEPAVVADWGHNYNNREWVCKTDSSCGYEVASRVFGSKTSVETTLKDLKTLKKVVSNFQAKDLRVNDRCGFHVHMWVGDFNEESLFKMLAYWVKFEKTLVDMMPTPRKRNSYCPCPSAYLRPNTKLKLRDLINMAFRDRGSLNYGWYEQRKTVEFRLAEGTVDPRMVENWVRFLLYFLQMVPSLPKPENVNWLSFTDIMVLLDLWNDPQDDTFRVLSPALEELRVWILERVHDNAGFRDSKEMKAFAKKHIEELTYVPDDLVAV